MDWPRLIAEYDLGEFESARPLTGGHIHRSFCVTCRDAKGCRSYVFQQINRRVFPHPEQVAQNISRVTAHLRGRLRAEGVTDLDRRSLTMVPARGGGEMVNSADGQCWRAMHFIAGSQVRESVSELHELEAVAAEFGRLQRLLADWQGPPLHETIPGFHDTPMRLAAFEAAEKSDRVGRAGGVRAEIGDIFDHRGLAACLLDPHRRGEFPLRVVHNDAKPSNLLIDAATGEPLCVIDLDTVMPGLSLFDFGDMVRSMASTAAEDEPDCSRVFVDPGRFATLARGYWSQARAFLTPSEHRLMLAAAKVITFEQAVRFFTDYLDGDRYYAVKRANHNLDRGRAQLALLRSLDAQESELSECISHLK